MPLFGPPNVIKLRQKRNVKKLIEALTYKDPSIRKLSAYALGELGDAHAVESLCAALKDKTISVRASSASALGKIADPRAIEPLCIALQDKDNSVRGSSSTALIKIGEPAVDSLIKVLKGDNKDARGSSLYALIKIGEPAVKSLCIALKDDIPHVRLLSADALAKISDARAVLPLCDALNDDDKAVRGRAASALGSIGDTRAVMPLIAALKDDEKDVRVTAIRWLGKFGDERAVEPLIALLKDNDKPVRWQTAIALGEIGDIRAVDPLLETLKNDDEDVRKKSAEALKKLGVQPTEVETQQEKTPEKPAKARPGPIAQSEKLIELFDRRKLDPAGKKILAFAMLYEFEKTAPAVWVGPGPDPLAAPDEGPEVRQTRFYASKIIPGYQSHFIPGHLTVDRDTAVVSRQFKPKERLDAAYVNQVLAVMLAPLVADVDLGQCSALSLSGESHALGQTRFAIVVGGAPKKQEVKLIRQYTKPIIPGVNGTYFEYEAGNLEEARAFLATKPITEMRFYIEVHTPEGGIGKDIDGEYEFDS